RRAVAHLAVRRAGGEPGRELLELDRGDELAAFEDRVALGVAAGQTVQAGDRDRPLALQAGDVHLRADRGQRDGHVGGVRRDARCRMPEDREVAVVALARRAATRIPPALALVAWLRDVLEVGAARALEQVAG